MLLTTSVMFRCPTTHAVVRAPGLRPMSRGEFEQWQDDMRDPQKVTCAICAGTHHFTGDDYFLEGNLVR